MVETSAGFSSTFKLVPENSVSYIRTCVSLLRDPTSCVRTYGVWVCSARVGEVEERFYPPSVLATHPSV